MFSQASANGEQAGEPGLAGKEIGLAPLRPLRC